MPLTRKATEPPSSKTGSEPGPRIGLVGCGRIGDVHRARLVDENAAIVAICDPDADALARMAGRLSRRPRLFRSEQDLLGAGIVDGVVLCTPHDLHAGQVRAALDAGVHVLCEKPFVDDAVVARALVARARAEERAADVSLIGDAPQTIEWIQLIGERGTAGWWMRDDHPGELFLNVAGRPTEHGDAGAHGVSPDAAFIAALRSGRSFGPDTAPDLFDAAAFVPVIALQQQLYAQAVWR